MGTLQTELKRAGKRSTRDKLVEAARAAKKAAPRNKDYAARQFVLRCDQAMWAHLFDTEEFEFFRAAILQIMRELIGEAGDDQRCSDDHAECVVAGRKSADGNQLPSDNQATHVPSAAGDRSQRVNDNQKERAPVAT